jgi:hypothetical protein
LFFVVVETVVLVNEWRKMKRAPVSIEEMLLEKAIKEECQWENLPKRLHPTVPTKEEWTAR